MKPLIVIKLIHTLIWIFFNIVIFYLLYAVIVDKVDIWVWICLALVFAEALVLVIFKQTCPVTLVARKYSSSMKDNFDIFLPNWLARHNKEIYTGIMVVVVAILVVRLIT